MALVPYSRKSLDEDRRDARREATGALPRFVLHREVNMPAISREHRLARDQYFNMLRQREMNARRNLENALIVAPSRGSSVPVVEELDTDSEPEMETSAPLDGRAVPLGRAFGNEANRLGKNNCYSFLRVLQAYII